MIILTNILPLEYQAFNVSDFHLIQYNYHGKQINNVFLLFKNIIMINVLMKKHNILIKQQLNFKFKDKNITPSKLFNKDMIQINHVLVFHIGKKFEMLCYDL